MEETAEVVEWYKPLTEWNSVCCMEFLGWLEGYKKESPDLTIEEALTAFRSVMDVGYCINEAKERWNYGWTDARGIFGSNSN